MIGRLLKYFSFGSLLLIVAVLVLSSIVVREHGVGYAVENIFHSDCFIALWALMSLSGLAYIFCSAIRKASAVFLLHFSFVVVLAGALITYCTSDSGEMMLVKDAPPASMYADESGELRKLDFAMQLSGFEVLCEDGSDVPVDYRATITVTDRKKASENVQVSMNNIYTHGAYRIYLMGYDEYGVSLHVSHDPYGLPVTYAGYALLLLSMLLLFVDRRSGFRPLLARFRHSAEQSAGTPRFRSKGTLLLWIPVTLLSAIALLIGCRWYQTGLFPASNGFDALMLFSWFLLFAGLFMRRGAPAISVAGIVLASVLLVVVLLSPDSISAPVLPVLRTPLLALHVTVIIISYSLLALLAVNAAVALYHNYVRRDSAKVERMALLGRLILYPATMLLMTGIFIGAVWANVSWGRYWGWDPKEVWALITLLLCSLPFHGRSMPLFMSMLFTYFGVNWLLGGMHSYM